MNSEAEKIALEWKVEREKHPFFGERLSEEAISRVWDTGAQNYSYDRYSDIREKVISALLDRGLIQGKTVMDIGCGPGTYVIPFSRTAKKVIAVDRCLAMLERLSRECTEASAANVEQVVADCRELPPGLSCDLAFTSLCPPMNYPEALMEMEMHSVTNAYVSSAAKGGSLETEIWKELGKDYSYEGYNTDFGYRYLKAVGRTPWITYFEQMNETEDTYENVVSGLIRQFSKFREMTEDLVSVIRDVVGRHEEDGIVVQKRNSRMGLLIWDSL